MKFFQQKTLADFHETMETKSDAGQPEIHNLERLKPAAVCFNMENILCNDFHPL